MIYLEMYDVSTLGHCLMNAFRRDESSKVTGTLINDRNSVCLSCKQSGEVFPEQEIHLHGVFAFNVFGFYVHHLAHTQNPDWRARSCFNAPMH